MNIRYINIIIIHGVMYMRCYSKMIWWWYVLTCFVELCDSTCTDSYQLKSLHSQTQLDRECLNLVLYISYLSVVTF